MFSVFGTYLRHLILQLSQDYGTITLVIIMAPAVELWVEALGHMDRRKAQRKVGLAVHHEYRRSSIERFAQSLSKPLHSNSRLLRVFVGVGTMGLGSKQSSIVL